MDQCVSPSPTRACPRTMPRRRGAVRLGLVGALCAVLGAGFIAGPHAASHPAASHVASHVTSHMIAESSSTPDNLGGPGSA